MDETTRKQLEICHDRLLEILRFFHAACDKTGAKYSLYSGTLLGAVRHKGFIPWDDDVDVSMDRDSFERLLAGAEQAFEGSEFSLVHDDRLYRVVFKDKQRLQGLSFFPTLDIFIMETVPKSPRAQKRALLHAKMLQGMLKGRVSLKKYSFAGKLKVLGTRFLGMFYSRERLIRKFDAFAKKHSGSDSPFRYVPSEVFRYMDILFTKDEIESVELMEFEGERFYCYSRYDEILTKLYGDYMTPPPPDEQEPSHSA